VKIRKQVYDLTVLDLNEHPVWEFALDEECEEGQDEATVRPFDVDGSLDVHAGMFVVRVVFTMADGTVAEGYLTPPVQGMEGIETYQPTIVSSNGQVPLWFGIFPPAAETLQKSYASLGKTSDRVFPLQYASAVQLSCGKLGGVVPGFSYFADEKKGWFKRKERVIRHVT